MAFALTRYGSAIRILGSWSRPGLIGQSLLENRFDLRKEICDSLPGFSVSVDVAPFVGTMPDLSTACLENQFTVMLYIGHTGPTFAANLAIANIHHRNPQIRALPDANATVAHQAFAVG